MTEMLDVAELAARVPDGASLALTPDYSGCALAAVRALIRRRARSLHLIGVPQLGFQADLLIGAGCVASLETAAVSLGEDGPAPRFVAAIKAGAIEIRDFDLSRASRRSAGGREGCAVHAPARGPGLGSGAPLPGLARHRQPIRG